MAARNWSSPGDRRGVPLELAAGDRRRAQLELAGGGVGQYSGEHKLESDLRLHYHEMGVGPTVLILHGLFGSGDNWTSIGRALEDEYRVVLADLPNHGSSPHIAENDYVTLADAVAEFIAASEEGGIRVVGHSMGGKVAMALALRHPELVERLVVLDIAPKRYEASHLQILDAMAAVERERPTTRAEADRVLTENGVDAAAVRAFLLKSYRGGGANGDGWKLNVSAIRERYDDILDWPDPAPEGYRVPVTVLYGERSGYVEEADRERFEALFSEVTMECVPGAGHWLHAEKPQKVVELLRNALA